MSILAVMEQRGGSWNRMSFETLAAAQQFAQELNTTASAAVLGDAVDPLAAELAAKQLEKVYAVEHELLKDYTPEGYSLALRQLIEQVKPTLVLFPHTYQVRDFLPKLATSLGKVAVSDVVSHRIDNGQIVFVRQLFQGKVNADVRFAGDAPHFASLQAGAFRADQLAEGSAPVEKFTPQIAASDIAPSRSICSANRSAPSIWARPKSSSPWAAASRRRTTSRSCKSSPTRWAANWRHRGPSATPAGFPWSGKWAVPARPSRRRCIWRLGSPAPFSIWWG